jgi:Na+/H+ antiporter NhaD/arsenite permease-like protein
MVVMKSLSNYSGVVWAQNKTAPNALVGCIVAVLAKFFNNIPAGGAEQQSVLVKRP